MGVHRNRPEALEEYDRTGDNATAVADGLARTSSPIRKSGTWSRTFDEPRRYDYVCTLHDDMAATVVVSDA